MSNSCNIILMIIDCLIIEKHYIEYTINKNNIILKTTTQLLFSNF